MRPGRAALALYSLTVLLPIAMFGAVSWERWGAIADRAERQTLATIASIEQAAQHVFQTQELVLDLVQDLVGADSDDAVRSGDVAARLLELADRLPQTISIWVTNAEGAVVAASTVPPARLNVTGLEYFEAHRETGLARYISAPYVGRTTGLASFAMSRRRPTVDGRFGGVLHVAISPSHFENAFALAISQQGGAAALLRADGTILARNPPRMGLARLDAASPLMRAIAAEPQSGLIRDRSTVDGTPRIYAYRQVEPFGVYVGYGVDLPGRIAEWRATLLRDAVLTALSIMLLLFGIWLTLRSQRARAHAREALQHELQRRAVLEAELAEARGLEALGRMARGVAHDFNNLLTVVLGNLEALDDLLVDDAQRSATQRARRAAETGAQLAGSLLAYARTQVLSVEPVVVAVLLQDILPVLQDMVGPRAQVSLHIAPGLPACLCDATQIRAALGNLVTNARDAMPAGGGRITISATALTLTAEDLAGSAACPGRFVRITVADDGHGMTEEVAAQAFAPFFTTKRHTGGSGLGLSHVYGVVTQLGGRAQLNSQPGRGTEVVIDLPAVDLPAAALPANSPGEAARFDQSPPAQALSAQALSAQALSAQALSPQATSRAAPHRILVVDDQVEIRNLAERILSRAGYDVVAADSASAAAALVEQGLTVDLILSDIVMPGELDGVALIAQLRRTIPELRALLMSGFTPDTAALHGAGAEFLAKPFSRQALLAAVESTLR